MTTRTYTTKSGNVFEWEENEDVQKAVEELHNLQNETNTESTTVG